MARRKFSKEFKAEAVALVLERGLSASQVARDLGVGQPTISRWVKAAKKLRLLGRCRRPRERSCAGFVKRRRLSE